MVSGSKSPVIFVGSDHAGFVLKQQILRLLASDDYVHLRASVVDCGCDGDEQPVDYPDIARIVTGRVLDSATDAVGILLCGTGIGMSMAANRSAGIRAALTHDAYTARMSREHNDANVLCMGRWVVDLPSLPEILTVWLSAEFAGGRHLRRISLFDRA